MTRLPSPRRRLAAALLLSSGLALLAPAAVQAQTDASLVDQVVAALRVGEQAEADFASMAAQAGGAELFTREAVVDSVRAALLADLRPDLLRDALPFLQSPAHARILDRVFASAEEPGSLTSRALGLLYGGEVLKKGTLADSVLAARYVEATGTTRRMTAATERVMRAVVASYPAARADLERRGQTADEAIAAEAADMEEMMGPLNAVAARLYLTGVPVGEVEAAIAYYQSPAGQYVARARLEGTLAAVVPGIARWAGEMATAQNPGATGELPVGPGKGGGPAAPGPRKG